LKTIQSMWKAFSPIVLLPTDNGLERELKRRTFYAGAMAAFDIVYSIGNEQVDEDAGISALEKLDNELHAFIGATAQAEV